MINSSENSFPKFDVENHQTMLNSKKHLNLKREIEETMGLYKNPFSNTSSNKNISIFFGVTATIFEALENGINVIHICSDPVFESHSEKIWPNLKVKQLSRYVFHYNLILSGKLINFGKKKTLTQILNTIF